MKLSIFSILFSVFLFSNNAQAIFNNDWEFPETGGGSCSQVYNSNNHYLGCQVRFISSTVNAPGPTCWDGECPPPEGVVGEAACGICQLVAFDAWMFWMAQP
ncbi:MAG: hypothetical protein KDD25_02725 [Bdellovibrionales bacterium]|nr:hypothetical protein [Bdellovibrionales bacterium]